MEILPIGIYGPYPAAGGATSCYLVRGESGNVVLDLGSGALSALMRRVDVADVDAFLLTHLHYDHFVDALALSYVPGRHVVYAPATPVERAGLLKNSKLDLRVIGEGASLTVASMTLDLLRTRHGAECYAVRVTERGKSFVYTSDTLPFEKLAEFCKGAELVIADCASAAGTPHMTPADGAALAKASGVRVIATHIPPSARASRALAKAGVERIAAGVPIVI